MAKANFPLSLSFIPRMAALCRVANSGSRGKANLFPNLQVSLSTSTTPRKFPRLLKPNLVSTSSNLSRNAATVSTADTSSFVLKCPTRISPRLSIVSTLLQQISVPENSHSRMPHNMCRKTKIPATTAVLW